MSFYELAVTFKEKNNRYWSHSRIYSAHARQWLSIDPTIIWNPETLLNKPGNWNSTMYCSGDPVNFVDPSGHYAMLANEMGRSTAYELTRPVDQRRQFALTQKDFAAREMRGFRNVATGLGILFSGPALVMGSEALLPFIGGAMLRAGTWAALNAKSTSIISSMANFTLGIQAPTYQSPSSISETLGIGVKFLADNFRLDSMNRPSSDGFRFYDHTPQSDPYSFGDFNFQTDIGGL